MLTYNHAEYIVQALDSVLMQDVDFEYEIVIGDDLSQDSTRKLLCEYEQRHPKKFRLLFYETKQGVGGNVYEVFKHCQGEYIAILEGDDYWTSPHKLKTQVAFLDRNPEFALCFHSVQVYSQIEQQFVAVDGVASNTSIYTLDDLMKQTIFPRTCSVVFRSTGFQLPEWVKQLIHLDFITFVFACQGGSLKYFDDVMAVYRRHNQGVYSGASRITAIRNNIKSFSALNQHFQYRYAEHLNLRKYYGMLARELKKAGQDAEAKAYFRQYLTLPNGGRMSFSQALKVFTVIYVPWLYTFYRVSKYREKAI